MQAFRRINPSLLINMSQHITRNTARAIGSKLTLENVIHDKANSEFYVKLDQGTYAIVLLFRSERRLGDAYGFSLYITLVQPWTIFF